MKDHASLFPPQILDDAMTRIDVFLSYAHKDNYYRKQIQKALEQRGLLVWVDEDRKSVV